MTSTFLQFLLLYTIITTIIHFVHAHKQQKMCGLVDYALATPSFDESFVNTQKVCFNMCLSHHDCKSTNYFTATHLCGLNKVSHLDSSQELMMVPGSFYAFNETLVSDCRPATTAATKVISGFAGSTDLFIEQDLSVAGKPSEQSSVYHDKYNPENRLVAGRANDGDTNSDVARYPYCSHTRFELNPWWRVDLGGEHWLGLITVVNRGDCCGSRLAGAAVRIGLSPDIINNMMCGSRVSLAEAKDGAWNEFACDPPTLARYVSVDITGSYKTLHICEVMIREYVRMKPCRGH